MNLPKKNGLSIVFHCGAGAQNLKSDTFVNYASSLPIEKIAKLFPEVNFIASHFDYPNFNDCAKIITKNANIYTDISGEYENFENRSYDDLIKELVDQIQPTINKYGRDKIASKTMFGTDYFGIGSGFDAVEEYIETCKILFGEQNLDNCLWNNCLKAYPKINYFLKKSYSSEKNDFISN